MSRVQIASLALGEVFVDNKTVTPDTLSLGVGSQVYIYVLGTATPVTVYSDATTGATLTQPLTADTSGTLPGYLASGQDVDFVPVGVNTRITVPVSDPADVTAAVATETTRATAAEAAKMATSTTLDAIPAPVNPVSLNNKKITALANGTAASDAAAFGQIPTLPSSAGIYVAAPTGTAATDTAAIQAAITALPAAGGTIVLQPGAYAINATLNFNGLNSVTLRGASGRSATTLIFSPASGSCITAQSGQGFHLIDIEVLYSSASYGGALIDLSATGTKGSAASRGVDTGYAILDGCYIGCQTPANRSANAELVNLDHCIIAKLQNCILEDANYGITGLSGATSYSNAIHVSHCTFINIITAPIHNPGQGWEISGECTFEQLSGGGPTAVLLDASITAGASFSFENNWVGDATVTGVAIDLQGTVLVAKIHGNVLGCGPTGSTGSCVRTGGTCRVLSIKYNLMSGSNGYDYNAGSVFDSEITYNNMIGLTAGWSTLAYGNVSPNSGNKGFWGFNYGNAAAGDLDSWLPPSGGFKFYGSSTEPLAAPTYGTTVTPDASKGPWQTITVTNTTAFTIAAPTNPPGTSSTTELVIEVLNSSGGTMGVITWNAAFKFANGTWANPASTKRRFARFEWNGTNWICTSLSSSDY